MEETSETSHLHLHLFASLEFIRNMFKPHAGVKVFFVDCFVDSRSYEASCSRWNRVLLPMMARRTSCCLPYLRSRKENFFCVLLVSHWSSVMSCGDFFLTFDFRSLNFGPFSLIAPKREAEERLNSEQQELSSLQSELIDAEVRLCACQVAFMYWNSFEFQGQSIFFSFFIPHSSCLDVTSGPGRELQARPWRGTESCQLVNRIQSVSAKPI